MAKVPVVLVFGLLLASFAVEDAPPAVDDDLVVAQNDTPKESKPDKGFKRAHSVELHHKQYTKAEQDFEALHTEYSEHNAVFFKLKKQARLLAHELDNMPRGARYKTIKLKLRQVEGQAKSTKNGLFKLSKQIQDSKHDLLGVYTFNHQVAVAQATRSTQSDTQINRKLDYAKGAASKQAKKLNAELFRFTTLTKTRPEFIPLTRIAARRAEAALEVSKTQFIEDKQALKDMKAAVLKAAKGSKLQQKRVAKAFKLAKNSVELAGQKLGKAEKLVHARKSLLKTIKKKLIQKPPSVCDSGFGSAKADCGTILDMLKEQAKAYKLKVKTLSLSDDSGGAKKDQIAEVEADLTDVMRKISTATSDKKDCLAAAEDTFRQCKLALFNGKESRTDIANLEKEQKEMARLKQYADEDAVTNRNMLASMTNHVNRDRKRVTPSGTFQYDNAVWYVNSDSQKQLVQYPTPPCHRATRGIVPANFEDAPATSMYLGKEESIKACEGPVYESLGDTTIYAHCKCNGMTDPNSNYGSKCARWGPTKKAWCFVSHKCQYPGAAPSRKDGGQVPSYNKVLEDCPQED